MAVAYRDDSGLTIIEVLVSVVVLLVGLTGSLYAVMSVMDHNYGNALRNEALKIAQEELECCRNAAGTQAGYVAIDGDQIVSCSEPAALPGGTIHRQFRSRTETFLIRRKVQTEYTQNFHISQKSVSVAVTWKLKGRDHSCFLTTILREP